MAEKAAIGRVPKYAWWFALLGGLIWTLFGLLILFLPGDPGNQVFFTGEPATYSAQASNDLIYAARVVGLITVVGGLLQLAIAPTAFKRGERWAWYAFATVLLLSAFSGYLAATGERGPATRAFLLYLPFWLPQALALLLPVRRFFPSNPGPAS